MQNRQRHKSGIGHRRRHSIHRAAAEVARPSDANRHEYQHEAQQRAASECQQKTPLQKITRRLLCHGDEQQRRHRYVIGKMHEPVGERTRYVTELSGQPAGDDHREDGEYQVDDLHPLYPSLALHQRRWFPSASISERSPQRYGLALCANLQKASSLIGAPRFPHRLQHDIGGPHARRRAAGRHD